MTLSCVFVSLKILVLYARTQPHQDGLDAPPPMAVGNAPVEGWLYMSFMAYVGWICLDSPAFE